MKNKKLEDMTDEERNRWAKNYANTMTLIGVGIIALAIVLRLSGVFD